MVETQPKIIHTATIETWHGSEHHIGNWDITRAQAQGIRRGGVFRVEQKIAPLSLCSLPADIDTASEAEGKDRASALATPAGKSLHYLNICAWLAIAD